MADDKMTSTDDLSSKAKIRRAAMEVIASRGPQRATVREIAEAAGLATGLIRHHFGGKQGLIDAVDESVVELIRGYLGEVPLDGEIQDISAASDAAFQRALAENPDVATYVGSSLLQFEEPHQGLLERLTDLTLEHTNRIRSSGTATQHDERQSALNTLMRQYGQLVLQPVIDRMWARMTDSGELSAPDRTTPRVSVRLSLS